MSSYCLLLAGIPFERHERADIITFEAENDDLAIAAAIECVKERDNHVGNLYDPTGRVIARCYVVTPKFIVEGGMTMAMGDFCHIARSWEEVQAMVEQMENHHRIVVYGPQSGGLVINLPKRREVVAALRV